MNRSVLLVCPEPLGHRHPAGVGIRFLEFAKVMVATGFEVTVLSADGGEVAGCRSDRIGPAKIRLESGRASVAVVQGHVANDFFAHARPLPTVIDLYDPYLIENFHYRQTHGNDTFRHDLATLLLSLDKGDFFICASAAQRLFYLGLLASRGRVHPARFETDPDFTTLMAIVPFGVPPSFVLEEQERKPALLFGGIYDWYDPVLAVESVALACKEVTGLTLTFTGHPNSETTPQRLYVETRRHVESRGYDFVRFEPWFPYAHRADCYRGFGGALLTFPRSLETDLAMRTRIFDYLWGGLPVISSSAPGTDEILHRYHAGVVVEQNDPKEFAAAISAYFRDKNHYHDLLAGTRAYASENQWEALLEPLLRFCGSPRTDEAKQQFAIQDSGPAVPPPTLLQRIARKWSRW